MFSLVAGIQLGCVAGEGLLLEYSQAATDTPVYHKAKRGFESLTLDPKPCLMSICTSKYEVRITVLIPLL